MILSELCVENRAGSFAVPEMEIESRNLRYKSPIYFTPLLSGELVDAEKLRRIVDVEYEKAGITKSQVDTGAIIITGETGRKENAAAVLDALSAYAGEFVVATAGPDLESVLAAKGAGAVEFSEKTGKRVLHMDIGGGTSNLALIEKGKIVATTCLNVGGRLVKLDPNGRLSYVSTVLEGLFAAKIGDYVNQREIDGLAELLTQGLEMAAGLREPTELLEKLMTKEVAEKRVVPFSGEMVISFSGGVADCIESEKPWLAFGDMGPELGQAIRRSRLCRGEYVLGTETIRATVIGAGCHSTQLSGSTVFHQNVEFPLKNLPVVESAAELAALDGAGILAMEGIRAPDYGRVGELAESILDIFGYRPLLMAFQEDMAKALGQQLALRRGGDAQILCIDRVKLKAGDYLDVGSPVGPALPVVIKTLVLGR
jgi:ethanolamine utilization protein EutA